MKNTILTLLLIYIVYCLVCRKEGFGIKRRLKQGVKGGLAVLRPVKRKVLVPIDKKFNTLIGSVSKQPPPDIPADKPPKGKSVWLHPAVITGGIVGTATGIGVGEIYTRIKRGQLTKRFEIYNPYTGKYEYIRIGKSTSIPEDERLFIRYDGPRECDRETGKSFFRINRKDL